MTCCHENETDQAASDEIGDRRPRAIVKLSFGRGNREGRSTHEGVIAPDSAAPTTNAISDTDHEMTDVSTPLSTVAATSAFAESTLGVDEDVETAAPTSAESDSADIEKAAPSPAEPQPMLPAQAEMPTSQPDTQAKDASPTADQETRESSDTSFKPLLPSADATNEPSGKHCYV